MKTIPLSQNLEAKVSDEDYEELSKYDWAAYRIAGTSKTGKVHLYGFKPGRKVKKEGEFYPNGKPKYKRVWMHNVIMNTPEGLEVDHIDGDPLNNTRENLRLCSHKENTYNRGKMGKEPSSIFIGVCFRKKRNKYEAAIKKEGKTVLLGYFDSQEEAARKYDEAAKNHYGRYARLNFPQGEK